MGQRIYSNSKASKLKTCHASTAREKVFRQDYSYQIKMGQGERRLL